MKNDKMLDLSVVIPAKNEAAGLEILLPELKKLYPEAELIVVNDGSTDNTTEVCKKFHVVEVFHRHSKGNGAAIKAGARAATGEYIVFMDGDGQHQASDIEKLTECLDDNTHMVVGARNSEGQANIHRSLANGFYNRLASLMVGHRVMDLTSGFRVVRREQFMKFLYLLPNGFSYPTTSTMAFFRAGYTVKYVPIQVLSRIGKSNINVFKDGIRFLLIIFKIGTLYSPLKLFFPVAMLVFTLGLSYYGYTYINFGQFTNMSALLFTTSMIVFLMGLVSEQITMLLYKDTDNE